MTQGQLSIDQFNDSLRQSQFYQDWMRAHGISLSGPLKLTDAQRKTFQRDLQAIGVPFDKGIEIDPAGNMNQDEGFSKHKKWMIPAAIAVGTLGLGAAGVGPAAALFGGGGSAAASGTTVAGTVASTGGGGAASTFGFGSLAPTLIGTGGQLAGNIIAGRGASKAEEARERAAAQALDWEKSQYFDEQSRLQPYRDMGGQAYARLGKMLGLEAPAAPPAAATPTNPVDRLFSFSRPSGSSAPTSAAGQPQVGQRKSFPNGRIGEWDGRGWKAVA
jgi:hypothetical protein